MSSRGRMRFLDRLRRRRQVAAAAQPTPVLPDPSRPPGNRGAWEEAALTNVDVTELVKQQIRSQTLPWEK